MSEKIRLKKFQIGTPRARGEGLRLAVTRRPQRGVPKLDRARIGCFDVWFPALAPSFELLASFRDRDFETASIREAFFGRYERELMKGAEGRQAISLIREIATRLPVSIGCFCADESRCHRSRLFRLIMNSTK
jgi:uncharacterized protein YeaO (DUF488 family)